MTSVTMTENHSTHPIGAFELPDLKLWLVDRLRRTNWIAAGIAGAFQLGFLAMLILMGVITVTPEAKRDKPLVTIMTTVESSAKPPPPAPDQQQPEDKPVVQPKAETLVPPAKLNLSPAPPVAAAVQRTPDPPAPAPAAASAPAAAAAPAAASGNGPVSANLSTNLLSAPKFYPAESRHKHEEGTVVLRIVVSVDGRVTQVSVHRSSGFATLDNAALTSVRKWRWSPTVRDGRPVEITGLVQIPFVLQKS